MSGPRIAIPTPASKDRDELSWRKYAEAIEHSGGIPVRIFLDEPQDALARIAVSCAAVLLPGSGADIDPEKYGERPIIQCHDKDPAREAADDLLLQDAFNLRKPILGICYGLQAINVWRNGTLIQDLPLASSGGHATSAQGAKIVVNHAPGRTVAHAHPVTISPGSKLHAILTGASDFENTVDDSRMIVNSSHHQAIDRPGDRLRVAARSPSDGVIEALEGETPDQFVLGVQWHPERSYGESSSSRALFAALVDAAAAWRPRLNSASRREQ